MASGTTKGGSRASRRATPAMEAVERIRRGLSYSAVTRLCGLTGWSVDTVAKAAGIPARTLARRQTTGRLAPDESDRIARIERIIAMAIELFEGDSDAAMGWMAQPRAALGHFRPMELLDTEVGGREVEHLITRLEHGVFS